MPQNKEDPNRNVSECIIRLYNTSLFVLIYTILLISLRFRTLGARVRADVTVFNPVIPLPFLLIRPSPGHQTPTLRAPRTARMQTNQRRSRPIPFEDPLPSKYHWARNRDDLGFNVYSKCGILINQYTFPQTYSTRE